MSADPNDGYDPTRNIDIAMIGPSGVGKTSLLATMNHMLAATLPSAFRFSPIRDDAHKALKDKYDELHAVAKTPSKKRLNTKGRRADNGISEYAFGLDHQETDGEWKKLARVTFFDTPGAFTEQLNPELLARLERADIVICAVDAGVLMETDDSLGNRLNGYANVYRLLDKHVFGVDSNTVKHGRKPPVNRLVLFVPIKAETWLRDNPDEMFDNFKKHYAASHKLFERHGGKRVGAYVPVETLGNVRFSHKEEEEDEVFLIYTRASGDFSPRHVHVPLLYVLRFALAEHQRRKGIIETVLDFFWGGTKEMVKAMERIEPDSELKAVKTFGAESLFNA